MSWIEDERTYLQRPRLMPIRISIMDIMVRRTRMVGAIAEGGAALAKGYILVVADHQVCRAHLNIIPHKGAYRDRDRLRSLLDRMVFHLRRSRHLTHLNMDLDLLQ